jgi:HlyD family secretion protein
MKRANSRSHNGRWLLLLLVASLGSFSAWKYFPARADKTVYQFALADRGDIVTQVTASGTVAAVTTVQVGSQVSGNIAELYADYNSEVEKGQLLARLDPQLFETQVQQAEANVRATQMTLNNDKASIAVMKANLSKAMVDVKDKQRKLSQQKELMDEGLVPKDDFDTARAALEAAVSSQNAAEAQLESAQAGYSADEARLQQALASLQNSKVNLEHTFIYSPVSGTIISRSVDRGQTVAASMAAPILFTIGEDLKKMQVNTSIDEADVGKIKTGMPASFTVDAYPGETFLGKINQVRLAATTVQNVVTYSAIINVENPQLKLKPGMTANVKISIQRVSDALRVPNAALRFRPENRNAVMKEIPEGSGAAVWVLNEGTMNPRPVFVQLGLTDGISTEVVAGDLKSGDKVVTGVKAESGGAATAATKSSKSLGMGGPMGGPMGPPPP